ncbi:MAG: class I SAM-dependent methyltransferase [Candidatus Pacearchaeota archaeon]
MEEKNQEEVWNRIAVSWNKYRNKPLKEVIEFLKEKKGKVLDLGCGSGRNFIESKRIEFYACDFSEEMIRLAKEKAKKEKMKVVIKKMENNKIPFEDNFFDYILCIAVLHCIPKEEERKKIIQEMKRVLKKEGKILLSVWSKNHKKIRNLKDKKEAYIPWRFSNETFLRYYYFFDKEELENFFSGEKFVIEKEWEDENIWFILRKGNNKEINSNISQTKNS